MEISNNQSWYVNPNTRQLTSNIQNTKIKDREAFNESMKNLLYPVEDLVQAVQKPIKLADKFSVNRQSNSVNIASGSRIAINDGYILTVKEQGVEVSGGNDPYDTEAYLKAQTMANSLASLLRNACGNLHTMAHSEKAYDSWNEGVSAVMGYLGIDTSKSFTVNGMKYGTNKNGWYESQADSEAKAAYEKLKADNRTYAYADEKTKKQIAYISDYYLEKTTEELKTAWQQTLEETGVNPFPQGFSSTLSQLAMEQDFATGGNDDIFGSGLESNIAALKRIIERIENPTGAVTASRAAFLAGEKTFYTALLGHLTGKDS
ncbi:MAG: hypothetical protein NC321_15080 [Clostridium sp.]|nr:hypothetical protein [Lachnoclostridium sp.]MCM1254141.1 hypothetical protein [Clostridium sp.]